VAPNHIWTKEAANLLTFLGVDHLTLDGNGGIDGQGAIWWDCYNRKVGFRLHHVAAAFLHLIFLKIT
jgi:hypothetical protein